MSLGILQFLLCALAVGTAQAATINRIVGGEEAFEGQFPHQVSLRFLGSHSCGGSIVSNRYILTAAHCVVQSGTTPYPAHYFTVRAGSIERQSGGVLVKAKNITVNENYGDFLHDVALIELEEPLIFSDRIQPIPLATEEVPLGSDVIISGWGRLWTGGDVPTKLQYNTLEAISRLKCRIAIGMNSETLLCLAHQSNNGACNGDSGGPAVYNGTVVGVAGFVVSGCGSSNPDGYAKVSYHNAWIKSIIEE